MRRLWCRAAMGVTAAWELSFFRSEIVSLFSLDTRLSGLHFSILLLLPFTRSLAKRDSKLFCSHIYSSFDGMLCSPEGSTWNKPQGWECSLAPPVLSPFPAISWLWHLQWRNGGKWSLLSQCRYLLLLNLLTLLDWPKSNAVKVQSFKFSPLTDTVAEYQI